MVMTTTSPFTILNVITCDDPAIDLEKTNIEEYAKERDLSKVKFLEGKTPSIFKIEKISASVMIRLLNLFPAGDSANAVLFLASCKEFTTSDGQEVKADGIVSNMAPDSWLDKVQEEVGYEGLIELMTVAARFQKLSKRDKSFL